MKTTTKSKRGQGKFLAGLSLLPFLMNHNGWSGNALNNASTTTNTDSNQDGVSDGNVATTTKDYEVKMNDSIRVTSANIRGSLKDAKCIAGTGEACSSKPYFMAGQVDQQMAALQNTVAQATLNQNTLSNYQDTSDSSAKTQYTPEKLCASVPSAFGCRPGDFRLLTSARESLGDAIRNGDPVLANGKDPTAFLASVDGFISKITSIRDNVLRGFSSALDFSGVKSIATNPTTGAADTSAVNSGQPHYNYDDYKKNSVETSHRATYGKEQWVGPLDLEKASARVEIFNGLEVGDPQTGRTLTLWQRATRRYQSFDLSRAYTLAKTEGARGQMVSGRAPASKR